MARPKTEGMRQALVDAAIDLIAEQGPSAPTAAIAKRAGVAHGSVFNHFAGKADLLNVVYIQLKDELNRAVVEDLPDTQDPRAQLRHLWSRWLHWGTSNPARRRALAQLGVSEQITEASRAAGHERSAVAIGVIRRASAVGTLKDQSIEFIGSVVDALAGATMDSMIREPKKAAAYRDIVFEALWKALQ